MVMLPGAIVGDPTIAAMKAAIKAKHDAENVKRDYLGASLIGRPCSRQIWYDYTSGSAASFEAETLMRFEDGHRTEDLTAARLRLVDGIELITHRDDGSQYGFEALGGKFKGHVDGLIRGLIQAPKAWHVWECKAVGQKGFDDFKRTKLTRGDKAALKNWNEVYFVQAQLYMHYFEIDRHYMTVALAGGRDYDSCRTEYQREIALKYIERAEKIISMKRPPERIGGARPDFFVCKMCSYSGQCYGENT